MSKSTKYYFFGPNSLVVHPSTYIKLKEIFLDPHMKYDKLRTLLKSLGMKEIDIRNVFMNVLSLDVNSELLPYPSNEPSKITDADFKDGDPVLVIGRYRGHPQYGGDVVVEFEASPSVTLPQSYVRASDVINLNKSCLSPEDTVAMLNKIFSRVEIKDDEQS